MNLKNIKSRLLFSIMALAFVVNVTSCKSIQNANNTQKGGVIGATGGALLGAIIGNNVGSGNSGLGAVIGGVVGGGAGVLIGNKMDKQAQQIEEEIPGAVVERIEAVSYTHLTLPTIYSV